MSPSQMLTLGSTSPTGLPCTSASKSARRIRTRRPIRSAGNVPASIQFLTVCWFSLRIAGDLRDGQEVVRALGHNLQRTRRRDDDAACRGGMVNAASFKRERPSSAKNTGNGANYRVAWPGGLGRLTLIERESGRRGPESTSGVFCGFAERWFARSCGGRRGLAWFMSGAGVRRDAAPAHR
jgi:hypothetical protein